MSMSNVSWKNKGKGRISESIKNQFKEKFSIEDVNFRKTAGEEIDTHDSVLIPYNEIKKVFSDEDIKQMYVNNKLMHKNGFTYWVDSF
jgi:hypothetical protein